MCSTNVRNLARFKIGRRTITLVASLILVCHTISAAAQSIQPIYSFTNNANPIAGLTLGPDGNLYGTTYEGGNTYQGTVFRITTNGALTTLVTFGNDNGAYPEAALALGPDGNFYGTTTYGGANFMAGTVFRMTTDGALTTLATFAGGNGEYPIGPLVLSADGNFYGTTVHGGTGDYGTVFRITTNGTQTVLASFGNTNGAYIVAGLTSGPDGNFYGTAANGGSNNDGTVFRVTTNGEVTALASLNYTIGAHPYAGLTLGPDGNFYSATVYGGLPTGDFPSGYGTIFRITTNGTLTTLAEFANTNGETPFATLTLGPDGNLYGTTSQGIGSGGTVFRITTNGALTTLATFDFTNGANPFNGLTLGPDGNFYGTTSRGGSGSGDGNGVIYRLNLPPSIITQPSNQIVFPGREATFAVALFGTTPFECRWLYNGTPIPDATNSTFTVPHVKPSSTGNYQVIVTNTWGGTTSTVATLTRAVPP